MSEQEEPGLLRAEVADLRSQLASANLEIADLKQQLAGTREQLATALAQIGVQTPSHKRASIQIPQWLRASTKSFGRPSSIEASQVDVMRSTETADTHPLRFTADEMPAWLATASQQLEAVEEDDATEQPATPEEPVDVPSSVIAITFDQIPDGATLSVKIPAHALVDGHVEHELEVTLDEQSWRVRRRYRDFAKLHADLGQQLQLGVFAVPKLLIHTPAALQQREGQLERFLAVCLAKARATKQSLPPLELFLGLHFALGSVGV